MPSTPDVPAGETPRRVGIFGGTFDPIHIAHLILVEEARYCLQLDQVLLVPAGDPPHKQGREVSPVEDRVRMCDWPQPKRTTWLSAASTPTGQARTTPLTWWSCCSNGSAQGCSFSS